MLKNSIKTTTVAFPYTGDYRVDVLLEGPREDGFAWQPEISAGESRSISYSFAETLLYFAGEDAGGFLPLTPDQRSSVRNIFDYFATVSPIIFTEVQESLSDKSEYGQIRIGNNQQEVSDGYAVMPGALMDETEGDLFLATDKMEADLSRGSYEYATIIHELGHSLGLAHPGNYSTGESFGLKLGNYLGESEDSLAISMMTYVEHHQGLDRIDLAPWDLLAMDYLYGLSLVEVSDTFYLVTDSWGDYLQTIRDDGGIDTVDLSAVSTPTFIDLRASASWSVGLAGIHARSDYIGLPAEANVQIAFGTVLENVIGSNQADVIVGNSANNRLMGGLGNDEIRGGAGIDVAVYNELRTSVTKSSNSWSVLGDSLFEIERIHFSDIKLALDLFGPSGEVAKVVAVVLGADGLSNKNYIGAGLKLFDSGASLESVCEIALITAGKFSNEDVVALLYVNLYGATPSTSAAQPYIDALNAGKYTKGFLAAKAAELTDDLGILDLVGLSHTGIEYI